jgi:protein SCO1
VHPRVLLAAVLTAALALGALALVAATSGSDGPAAGPVAGPSGFVGALRPEVPPQDFALRDEEGRPASLRALRGQVVVLTFLYATCDDTCPTIGSTVGGALDRLEEPVPALAVSVDPEGDTPAAAQRFLLERGLRGRMRFLLGDRAALAPVWRAYGIQPQGEAFDHSAYVLLVDRQGRQRVGHPFSALTADGLARDIRRLQAE